MLDFLRLLLISGTFVATDLIWWWAGDRVVRRWRGAVGWRVLVGGFALAMVVYAGMWVRGRFTERVPGVPLLWAVTAYMWHLGPGLLAVLMLGVVAGWKAVRRSKPAKPQAANGAEGASEAPALSRRAMLARVGLVSLPPLATGVFAARGATGLGEFRTREIDLAVPELPADLEGLTIAHVSDLHIGQFLPAGVMERVAEATNAMGADLVAFTGDLLDTSCEVLAPGWEFVRMLDPRHGMVMIAGNHDQMRGAERFEGAMLEKGLPLLLDDARTFRVPGRATPVQLLGITWGELKFGRDMGMAGRAATKKYRDYSKEATAASLGRVWGMREAGTFPIVLAHHPHAFDPAAELGAPLVLAGHTHGGQINLTENFGVGSLRFRYWRGTYEKPGSRMFVNSGVGNWFPLRINAPAEVVKVRLKRA
jgi:predicted MPP superfamily phosphohydrolase